MKKLATAGAALLTTTALAQAGGIERNAFTTGILFEEGTYAELSYGFVEPEVSGSLAGLPVASGDVAPGYSLFGLSYRMDLTDQLSLAFVIDQPVGADVEYGAATGYPFAGSNAQIRSQQLTAMLRYEFAGGFSAYGGIRAVMATGTAYVANPLFSYQLDSESEIGVGYMVGGAYERPDIALRVALTYFSEVSLDFTGTENPAPAGTPAGAFPLAATAFNVTLPQSVLLEAQSGIAPGTLLFGSVRWTDWGGFNITPQRFPGGSLVSYDDDVMTYTLGIGRQLNDNWAVSASIGYEAELGGFSGNLGPTDGRTSLGLGAEYTLDIMTISAGIQYTLIGDAETIVSPVGPVTSTFTDNSALAVGIRVGFQF